MNAIGIGNLRGVGHYPQNWEPMGYSTNWFLHEEPGTFGRHVAIRHLQLSNGMD